MTGNTTPPVLVSDGQSFAPEVERLLWPAQVYAHPRQVIEDNTLSLAEKRAILSSWASDACAVDSMPALRQAPGAPAPVTFDDVMQALRELDGVEVRPSRFRRRAKPTVCTEISL
ncbi:hypothetical protein ACFQU1_22545 [Chelatococcus sp. GCM10030263]|uniref:hypothetical protein n=1 Tax=Chelatococcus sp. GCM10030263 TaxID=3273387 RepID=UPI00361E0F31